MKGAVAHAGGLPRPTMRVLEERAQRIRLDLDASTPTWARSLLREHLDELRVGVARKILMGFALWECAAVLVSQTHPAYERVGGSAAVMDREDLADLVEEDRATSKAVLAAPDDGELRVLVLRATAAPWVGGVRVTDHGGAA